MLRPAARSPRGVVSALAMTLAILLPLGCASRVAFMNASPETPIEITATLRQPHAEGRFPAVVILHGCEGVSSTHERWARRLTAWGYATLVVDSWTPRRLVELCSYGGPDVPITARFDDGIGALRYLQALPHVRRERVGVIGFSNGGVFSVALVNGPSLARAEARGVQLPSAGFAAAVGVYPGGCQALRHELVVAPLLVLIGEADDWTRPGPCVEMVDNMRARGADAAIVLYPGAYHYFDVEGLSRTFLAGVENANRPQKCCGATVEYDARAAADARDRVRAFFRRHLDR
jgi:dienelactone hydrolase